MSQVGIGLSSARAEESARRRAWRRSWYRFRRNPAAVVGLAMVALVVLAALAAPLLAPSPQSAGTYVNFAERHQPPSLHHLFGTDNVGRDVFSRVLYGYRVSLLLVVFVLGLSVPFGVLLGLLAGYYGGWVETVIMRVTDIFLAIPALVMALAITAALTPSLLNAMIAISLLWWNWHTRLIYTTVSSLRNEDYVEAAKLAGAGDAHILFREILPNCVSVISVKVTLDAGFVILIGAGLSFLGLGARPPTPDLGTMVASGANYLPEDWWESVLPGLGILFAILGFNLLGDGLRDLLDVEVS
ncbi:MAG TPA: ABC transporter permease [Trueperaceae bacterium]|nr:ABC transporter permease [Trueperaceae bacterium]